MSLLSPSSLMQIFGSTITRGGRTQVSKVGGGGGGGGGRGGRIHVG